MSPARWAGALSCWKVKKNPATATVTFPYWKLLFSSSIFKQLLLRNCAVDFVEISNVYVGNMNIKAAKRILNSVKICRSYSDLNFGVTFLERGWLVGWSLTALSTQCSFTCQRRVSSTTMVASLPHREFTSVYDTMGVTLHVARVGLRQLRLVETYVILPYVKHALYKII